MAQRQREHLYRRAERADQREGGIHRTARREREDGLRDRRRHAAIGALAVDLFGIHFLGDAYRGSYDGEKYLDVGLPRELVSAGHFEEIKVETTDAYTIVGADVSGRIKLSTVGGDARVMGATCPTVEIETVNGSVGVVDGTWGKIELSTVSGAIELAGDAESAEIETASGKVDIAGALGALDFESVSGDLILATERALRLDAETESGSIYLTLPAQDGFTLDYETKSGAFRSTLTEREGALITCGDHEAYYTVPALDGGAVSELEISTVSGTLTIDTSSGSN